MSWQQQQQQRRQQASTETDYKFAGSLAALLMGDDIPLLVTIDTSSNNCNSSSSLSDDFFVTTTAKASCDKDEDDDDENEEALRRRPSKSVNDTRRLRQQRQVRFDTARRVVIPVERVRTEEQSSVWYSRDELEAIISTVYKQEKRQGRKQKDGNQMQQSNIENNHLFLWQWWCLPSLLAMLSSTTQRIQWWPFLRVVRHAHNLHQVYSASSVRTLVGLLVNALFLIPLMALCLLNLVEETFF